MSKPASNTPDDHTPDVGFDSPGHRVDSARPPRHRQRWPLPQPVTGRRSVVGHAVVIFLCGVAFAVAIIAAVSVVGGW
ncbi:hypothetical protein [Pseudonocardia sp. HH130630-07]|uniref:hypothetical protein n=1 Tax=Pseudonocardia sp. HH130630-07 TaxID=1690815 RepID=UPI0012EA0EDA|nr:hypothetical protein [Pseudonocardia sp. HH130630-07]